MPLLNTLLLAVGLAMDACAVSVASGAGGQARGRRAAFRLAFHFGLFQFLMPVIGWYAGSLVARHIAAVDHWIAFGLLAVIGSRMIRSGLHPPDEPRTIDPSRGWSLILLSVATSIDALAVGLGLALLQVSIWLPAVVIGLVTVALSLAGLYGGIRLGRTLGHRMEVVGGVVLWLVGTKILLEHLTA